MSLEKQLKLVTALKRLTKTRLYKMYHRVFRDTEYFISLPRGGLQRSDVEKRIWQYYCLHHPDDTDPPNYLSHLVEQIHKPWPVDTVTQTMRMLRNPSSFSQESINVMPETEVDRCLTILGIVSTQDVRLKKRMLFLYFHSRMKRGTRKEGMKRFGLIDILEKIMLKNPEITYSEYHERYRGKHPTMSPTQFRNMKWRIRHERSRSSSSF